MNEKDKNTLMALYPIITNDPEIKPVNKAIFKRLYLRATGLKPNTVNSRLIKNKEELQKKTFDQRYLFIDENEIGTQPIQNAMYELPQSQIKTDVWNMMSWLENEAKYDSKIDSLQQ